MEPRADAGPSPTELRMRKSLRGVIRKDLVLRSALILVTGSVAAQGVAALALPFLTRIYSPAQYGVFGAFSSLFGVTTSLVALRYELAILLPKGERRAFSVFVLCLIVVAGLTLLLTGLVLALGTEVARLVRVPQVARYLPLLPAAFAIAGLTEVFTYWAVRSSRFRTLATTRAVQSVTTAGAQLTAGTLPLTGGLIEGDILGRLAGAVALGWYLLRDSFPAASSRPSLRNIVWAAKRYRRFPILSGASALLNAGGLRLPLLAVAGLYGATTAGWFSLAQQLTAVPTALLGTAVGRVYTAESARLVHSDLDGLSVLLRRTVLQLLLLGVIPALVLAFGAPRLFPIIFGSTWLAAGRFAQPMALLLLAQFTAAPVSQTLNVLELQSWQLSWDTGRMVLALSSIGYVYIRHGSALTAITAYSAAMAVAYVFLLTLCTLGIRRARRLTSYRPTPATR